MDHGGWHVSGTHHDSRALGNRPEEDLRCSVEFLPSQKSARRTAYRLHPSQRRGIGGLNEAYGSGGCAAAIQWGRCLSDFGCAHTRGGSILHEFCRLASYTSGLLLLPRRLANRSKNRILCDFPGNKFLNLLRK